ncbi:WxL protein peptidoglycan domain-containing protein [Microbacterium sp. PMB16]|uniref:WxL protein peptidoglycan domain-containing protein n=1 Tax=Microbacterium sp. PMB16 TaxID=3120157 RepID=UPI003F4C8150
MNSVRFRSVLVSALAALALLGAPAAAVAAEGDGPISWSVTPADASGPDGRVFVEHAIDPGETVDDHLAVRNLGAEQVTFRLSAADGFYNANGRFDMLRSDQESVAAGTWITLPESITVAPGATAVVPFSLTVPESAEPGDHAAGITASVISGTNGEGTGVGVESRVGFKVMTQVTGPLLPAFSVEKVQTDYSLSWNPFRPGDIATTFTVVNTGNTRLMVEGALDVAGQTIAFPAEGERRSELLPGEERTYELAVDDVWPLFGFAADLTVAPVVSSSADEATAVAAATATAFVWAMPWPHLLVIVGIALLLVALLWNRIRSRRRIDGLVEKAVERGRQQALRESRAQAESV